MIRSQPKPNYVPLIRTIPKTMETLYAPLITIDPFMPKIYQSLLNTEVRQNPISIDQVYQERI